MIKTMLIIMLFTLAGLGIVLTIENFIDGVILMINYRKERKFKADLEGKKESEEGRDLY